MKRVGILLVTVVVACVLSSAAALAQDSAAEDYMAFMSFFVGDWDTTTIAEGGKSVTKGTLSCEMAPTKQCLLIQSMTDGEPNVDGIDGYDPQTKSWKMTRFGADGTHWVAHFRLDPDTLKGMPIGKTLRARAQIFTKDGGKAASEGTLTLISQDRFELEVTIRGSDGKRQLKVRHERQPRNYKHLKDLEYFVGNWVTKGKLPETDEPLAGQEYVGRCSIEWILNKNAQQETWDIRIGHLRFGNKVLTGWDPATQQIKQWVLDSGGGRGESVVTRRGDAWVYEGFAIDANGTETSTKSIITIVDRNTQTLRVTARKKPDGTPLPDLEITLKRVRPKK